MLVDLPAGGAAYQLARQYDDAGHPRGAIPVAAAGPDQESCQEGGLDAVVNGSDLGTASAHLGQCTACQREFLSRGGLLPRLGSGGALSRPASSPDPDADSP